MAMFIVTPDQKEEFLEHIRAGMRRGAASDVLELDRRKMRDYIEENADFEAAVLDAEIDATEHVQEALYQAAVSGNVAAAKAWLEMQGVIAVKTAGRPSTQQQPTIEGPSSPFADLDNVSPLPRRRERSA